MIKIDLFRMLKIVVKHNLQLKSRFLEAAKQPYLNLKCLTNKKHLIQIKKISCLKPWDTCSNNKTVLIKHGTLVLTLFLMVAAKSLCSYKK